MQNKREFGLILNNVSSKPSQKQPVKTFVSSTKNLNDSSDDEEITQTDYKALINKSINKQQDYNTKKISEEISKNIKEDPNIYEYDNLYDDFDYRKNQSRNKSNLLSNYFNDTVDQSKPKYLNSIMAASEKRKIEQSLTREKVEKKRREREEGEYGDKPKFVTKSYEEALALQKKNDIEITKKEKMNTVNSEFGMMGFYSNLLTKNTAMGSKSKNDEETELLKIYQSKKKDYEKFMNKEEENEEKESNRKERKNEQNQKEKNKRLEGEEDIKDEIKKWRDISDGNSNKHNSEYKNVIINKDESIGKNNLEEIKLRYLERKRMREEKKE